MELNTAKCPFVWDWESLVMLPSKAVEEPKKFNMLDSVFQALDGSEVGSLHSYGGKSDCGSVSDLAYGSSSKSSKSAASVDSSSNRETREPPKFSLEISDCSHATMEPADPWPPTTTSATTAAAVCRSSPMAGVSSKSNVMLMGLKLGKRTYFEDFSASSNSGTRPSGSFCGSSNGTGMMKRSSKLSSIEIPHCQVDGCNLDLSSAKDYHRKHRVCETHSKSSKVVICGLERRFCQQCSRFHGLSEFDQKKRSCRRRLSNHNARRRKPKPEIIQFNSLRLPPSLRTNLAFNQVPVVHIGRANTNLTWDFTSNSKYTQEDEEMGLLEQPDECGFKYSYASSPLLQTSASNMQVFHPDLQQVSGSTTPAHLSSSNNITEAANQTQEDLRALSLLSSNNSWGVASCDPHQEQPPSLRPHQNQSQQQHRFDQRGGSGTTTTSSILHCTSGPTSAPVIPLSLPTPQSVSAVNYWQINELQTTPSFHKDVSSNYDHRYPLSKATNGHGFFLY